MPAAQPRRMPQKATPSSSRVCTSAVGSSGTAEGNEVSGSEVSLGFGDSGHSVAVRKDVERLNQRFVSAVLACRKKGGRDTHAGTFLAFLAATILIARGQRLKALREGGGAALTRLRRFSSSADGLAEDYAALVEETVTRLGELEPVKVST